MKKKLTLLAFAFTLCLLVANTAHAADGTVISVSPLSTVVQEADIGKTFQVAINITDSPNCVQWMMRISWNPVVLNLTVNPIEGPWLKSFGTSVFLYKNINASAIGEMTDALFVEANASGSGDLVYLNFTAKAAGLSDITIYESAFINAEGDNLTYTVVPGQVTVIPEFPASMIVPLFMMLTAAAIILIKVFRPGRRRESIIHQ